MKGGTIHLGSSGVRLDLPEIDPVTLPPGPDRTADVIALEAALADLAGSRAAVLVELAPPFVQTRTLRDLPPVRSRDLELIVRRGATRFFRPGPDPVHGAMWVRDVDGTRIARAVQASGELLGRLEEVIESAGLGPVRFVTVGGDGERGPELFTTRGAQRRRRRFVLTAVAMLVTALSGWIASAGLYAYDLARDHRVAGEALTTMREPLARIDSIQARMSRFEPVARAATRQHASSAWLAPFLVELARRLPNDLHLHRVSTTRSGATVLECHGADAVRTVERISEWWPAPVRLESDPIPDSSGVGPQRFTIILEATP